MMGIMKLIGRNICLETTINLQRVKKKIPQNLETFDDICYRLWHLSRRYESTSIINYLPIKCLYQVDDRTKSYIYGSEE